MTALEESRIAHSEYVVYHFNEVIDLTLELHEDDQYRDDFMTNFSPHMIEHLISSTSGASSNIARRERMMEMAYTKRLFWEGTVVPAKVTLHEDQDWTWEVLPLLRGWQYWETIGVQAGISDPFITHSGLYLHVGVDPSEVVDFLLGLFTIDLKGDDIPIEELEV